MRELRDVEASRIELHINSPGGDVFDGIAIFRALKDHAAEITVHVDSIAASIASVIAMAGDRILMARHSQMMMHEAFGLVIGDAGDMRKQAEMLDRMSDTIADIYAERAGGTTPEWRAQMAAETWFSDKEAVEAGLADAIADEDAVENRFDLSIFRHAPRAEHSEQQSEAEQQDDQPAPPDWREEMRFRIAEAELEVA